MNVIYLVFFQMWDFIEVIIVHVTWEKKKQLKFDTKTIFIE